MEGTMTITAFALLVGSVAAWSLLDGIDKAASKGVKNMWALLACATLTFTLKAAALWGMAHALAPVLLGAR